MIKHSKSMIIDQWNSGNDPLGHDIQTLPSVKRSLATTSHFLLLHWLQGPANKATSSSPVSETVICHLVALLCVDIGNSLVSYLNQHFNFCYFLIRKSHHVNKKKECIRFFINIFIKAFKIKTASSSSTWLKEYNNKTSNNLRTTIYFEAKNSLVTRRREKYLFFIYSMLRKGRILSVGLGRCIQIPAYPLKLLKIAILKEANRASPQALATVL